jgi:hypothetical protein
MFLLIHDLFVRLLVAKRLKDILVSLHPVSLGRPEVSFVAELVFDCFTKHVNDFFHELCIR